MKKAVAFVIIFAVAGFAFADVQFDFSNGIIASVMNDNQNIYFENPTQMYLEFAFQVTYEDGTKTEPTTIAVLRRSFLIWEGSGKKIKSVELLE